MKKYFLFYFVLILLVAQFTESCSKKGDPGNIVNTVDTFQLANADYAYGYWTLSTGPSSSSGMPARIATRNEAKITQKVFNSGTVLVYLKTPSDLGVTPPNQYVLLPFTITGYNASYLNKITYGYEAGKLRIYYYYEITDAAIVNPPNIYTSTVPTYTFKTIIIPGSDGYRQSQPPVNYQDYEAVKKYYNLPD